ncbi:uncharacterized protein [Drosophila bipectinata]|uniref:uncharacterized protein n=1 Tax=Drosophila bipectinata TaxID=42026 RepID=UPI001C8A64BD|nr:serine/threonine-protein kinase CLA4 [Drosophila bipectinata]
MRLSLLLLVIQSWALVARATPAKHWRRAPAQGVFNVDVYAYNKPRMNLVRRQAGGSLDAPPMGHLLQQISQHSRRSADPRSHYRNLDGDVSQMRGQTIEDPAINMQLMPLQVNSSQHAQGQSHLYSSEFHVQNIGAKKIVQLNTLSSDHDRKPVVEEVVAEKQEQQQQQPEQPLKVKLSLPELPEQQEQDTIKKPDTTPLTIPGAENPTSVKKTMAPSGTIIDMAATGMQELVNQSTGQNADDTNTKASNVKKRPQEAKVRPGRPKTRRKQTGTQTHTPTGTRTSNETDTKMTASQASNTAVTPAPVLSPILKPSPGPGSARQPMKELETQSPKISTHRPLATKSKSQSKGKGKNKRRQGASQRRPASGAMAEEIETTTNWWQILPYAEIRKFLNTIYDTIADDVDDERATDDV